MQGTIKSGLKLKGKAAATWWKSVQVKVKAGIKKLAVKTKKFRIKVKVTGKKGKKGKRGGGNDEDDDNDDKELPPQEGLNAFGAADAILKAFHHTNPNPKPNPNLHP